ncbi:MAG TPA: hypothetical protein VEV82_05870 [Actinomycetota bacterium]|nr:hypothetical protein [Actinomycetota bacterium]
MGGTPSAQTGGTRALLHSVVKRLEELGEGAVDLAQWQVRLDAIGDTVEVLAHDVELREATLALCQLNLADERKRLRAASEALVDSSAEVAQRDAEVAQRDSELRDLRERLAATEARVSELGPFEVSAKYQLLGLRRTLPAAVRKRMGGGPGSMDRGMS